MGNVSHNRVQQLGQNDDRRILQACYRPRLRHSLLLFISCAQYNDLTAFIVVRVTNIYQNSKLVKRKGTARGKKNRDAVEMVISSKIPYFITCPLSITTPALSGSYPVENLSKEAETLAGDAIGVGEAM